MRVFAIKDDEENNNKIFGHLFYYEKAKKFFIELPDDADYWETPLLLSSFLKKGIKTIDSNWSMKWVQQRIIPQDRQNLGAILKANGLDEYDEFKLLLLANGRCSQDTYYLEEIDTDLSMQLYRDRENRKIDDILVLKNNIILLIFQNGVIKKFDLYSLSNRFPHINAILKNDDLLRKVSIQVGGYGICWGDNVLIPNDILYHQGLTIPLEYDELITYFKENIINTQEATKILECSRQNINELTQKGKLEAIKSDPKNKYYKKSDIIKRNWY